MMGWTLSEVTFPEVSTAKKVFITGSSEGLGLMAGRLLAEEGHLVVLHARSEARAGSRPRGAAASCGGAGR